MKRKAIIFDIDGTLADISHRLHYIQGEKKDYDGFYRACTYDTLKKDVAFLLDRLSHYYYYLSDNVDIFIFTGRPEDYRDRTEDWLVANKVYHQNNLRMRPSGDYRADYIIKEEMLRELQKTHDVIFTVDDRQQVVDMWRRNGITCFQCEQWAEKPKHEMAKIGRAGLMN